MKLYLYYLNIHKEYFDKFKRIFDIMEYWELPFIDKNNNYQYFDYGLIALYAFTNDKNIDKLFRKERNMKYFVREVKDITKEEYKTFQNNHSENEILIQRIKKSDNKYIKLLAPSTEISYVQDGYKDDIVRIFAKLPDLDIFNEEYTEVLINLGILDIQECFPYFPESISIREFDFYISTFGILYNDRG